MSRKGRPRKAGPRTKSDRPIPTPAFDKGTDIVQAKVERFGQDHATAIGRAFAAGLLGEGEQGKTRYDVGKKFARLRRAYFGRSYRCPLNDTPRGMDLHIADDAKDASDYAWFTIARFAIIHKADRLYMDQLLSDEHADSGPYWLDMLLGHKGSSVHHAKLACAIAALDAIAPKHRTGGIVASVTLDTAA